MNQLISIIGAAIAGVCVALEPAVNSSLGKYIPLRLAVLNSFLLGTLTIFIINILNGGFKEYRQIIKAPPYLWLGGLLGLLIVYLGAKAAPVLGTASTLTIMVAVQLSAGMIIDYFGLLGSERIPVDARRVVGFVLMLAAMKLIVR